MYQDTKNANQPTVVAKIKGKVADEVKKDSFVWYSYYENILQETLLFVAVEKADNKNEEDVFEHAVSEYFRNLGCKIINTKYYENPSLLKKYLKF